MTSAHTGVDPMYRTPDTPTQDVLPWLGQAILDYETECYRPRAHYLRLFKGAEAEIKRLRARPNLMTDDALRARIAKWREVEIRMDTERYIADNPFAPDLSARNYCDGKRIGFKSCADELVALLASAPPDIHALISEWRIESGERDRTMQEDSEEWERGYRAGRSDRADDDARDLEAALRVASVPRQEEGHYEDDLLPLTLPRPHTEASLLDQPLEHWGTVRKLAEHLRHNAKVSGYEEVNRHYVDGDTTSWRKVGVAHTEGECDRSGCGHPIGYHHGGDHESQRSCTCKDCGCPDYVRAKFRVAHTEEASRLLALARVAANDKHAYRGYVMVLNGHKDTFDTCLHPDCVLVRAGVSAPPQPQENRGTVDISQDVLKSLSKQNLFLKDG